MKISASFLTSKNPAYDLKKLNDTDVDYIHVDIMDGKFVKNKTMPYREMKTIYKYTSKRLDVHLMVENPMKYIPLYAELNTEYLSFHVEADCDTERALRFIREYSIKAGLAISPNTPVSDLIPYLPYLDMVLVMGVEPGKGGQEFIEETADRIKELKGLFKEYHASIVINVDGGINESTAKMCQDADILTSGNYIISSNDFQEKISSLRG